MNPATTATSALAALGQGCIVLHCSHTQNLRWANSALTTNGDMRTVTMTAIAFESTDAGTRVSVSSGQVDGPEDAARMATACRQAAQRAPVLDAAPLVPGHADDNFEQPGSDIEQESTQRMLSAVSTFLAQPEAQFGYAELDRTTTYLATSAGTRHRVAQDSVRIEASARNDHGSTWWGSNTLDTDFARAAATSAERLSQQRRRADLQPGRHRVILSPGAVADLLIYLAWTASGRDAADGHNVFARPGGGTRIGERFSPRAINLFSDPHHPGLRTGDRVVVEANSSTESVFDNGMELAPAHFIERGRLRALRASRPTAAKYSLATTYLADNLILEDRQGHGDLDDLIARTDDAVLINCLWYIREVDPQNLLLTGLTRDGVYLVQDGRITSGAPNFRFNVSVTDLLARITDATESSPCLPREWADWFTRTSMPALLVDGFNLSSRSEAR